MSKKKGGHKLAIALILILAAVTLIFGTKAYLFLNFFLGNDVVIKLEADNTSLSLVHGEEKQVEFKARVTTNPFCKAVCSYSFLDISNNSVVDSDEFSLRPGVPFEVEYGVKGDKKGMGQKIYRFDMGCYSVNTFLCHTSGESTSRNLLIVADYDLSEEEKSDKEAALKSIEKGASVYESALSDYDVSTRTISKLDEYATTDKLKEELRRLGALLDFYNSRFKSMENLWEDQDYEEVLESSNKLRSDIETVAVDVLEFKEEVSSEKDEFNSLLDSLISAKEKLEGLNTFSLENLSVVSYIESQVNYFNNVVDNMYQRKGLNSKKSEVEAVSQKISEAYLFVTDHVDSEVLKKETLVSEAYDAVCSSLGNCVPYIVSSDDNIFEACSDISDFRDFYDSLNGSVNVTVPPYCGNLSVSSLNVDEIGISTIDVEKLNFTLDVDFKEPLSKCCVFGKCDECKNDVSLTPVVFLHGHAFDEDTAFEYGLELFNKLQKKLEKEGYVNAGAISLYTDVPEGVWSNIGDPLSIKASYYFDIFREPENYVIVQIKSYSIDAYAVRLNELLHTIRDITGKPKVVIVAHSMGGLVTRRYMQIFGSDDVEKLIIVGTPNYGVGEDVTSLCPIFGEQLECDDMAYNSLFLNKLNGGNVPDIPVVNIVGSGCKMRYGDGDGVVLAKDAELEGAENIIVNGTCNGLNSLHTDLLNIDKYPEVYDIINASLQ